MFFLFLHRYITHCTFISRLCRTLLLLVSVLIPIDNLLSSCLFQGMLHLSSIIMCIADNYWLHSCQLFLIPRKTSRFFFFFLFLTKRWNFSDFPSFNFFSFQKSVRNRKKNCIFKIIWKNLHSILKCNAIGCKT